VPQAGPLLLSCGQCLDSSYTGCRSCPPDLLGLYSVPQVLRRDASVRQYAGYAPLHKPRNGV
jgi:hypothetical protein